MALDNLQVAASLESLAQLIRQSATTVTSFDLQRERETESSTDGSLYMGEHKITAVRNSLSVVWTEVVR